MKVPPMPVTPSSGLNCMRTGNPCGTDTWMAGTECGCVHCQRWLGRRDGYAEGFAAALRMIAPKCNCGCIHTDYECVKCAVLKRAAASALAE